MEPKRRIPTGALSWVLSVIVVAFLVNIASARFDDKLVKERGEGYPMQLGLTVVGWDYLPHVIAVVGIFFVWWWSQGAPAERIVERIEYRDPEPTEAARRIAAALAARTTWKGAVWKWNQGRAIPCCPETGHEEQQLVFVEHDGSVLESFPAHTLARPKCVFAEEHTVQLDDGILLEGGWIRSVEYEGIAREARARLRG